MGGSLMRICVICEGSYPFVAGGVSSWLHGLIKAMPQHEFVIWAIGAQEKQKGHYAYELPGNAVQLADLYLDSMSMKPSHSSALSRKLNEKHQAAIEALFRCAKPDWETIFSLFRDSASSVKFLSSREFLSIIENICRQDYPHVGFTEYFWTIRSMFLPLLFLMGSDVPQADLYYSVSAGYAGILGSMACVTTGKPFILTEHGIYTREREEEILRSSWVPAHFKDLWIKMFYMFTHCAYHHAGRVTSLFHRASQIQQEIGCPAEKCLVIPNGVNYDRFSLIPMKRPDDWIDIGAIVRIVPIKDIKTMLYAFSIVMNERQNVRLHIMGPLDEDPEYYEECVRLKEDLGLTNAIFTGRVNILEYLEKIDFTLLTSLSEGQPLAVLEAMAAGRPAITTDVGSCRELIEGADDQLGPAGICVPVMHQSALAEAILALCDNERDRVHMGENGKNRVQAQYRHNMMIDRYLRLFDQAAGGASWQASDLS